MEDIIFKRRSIRPAALEDDRRSGKIKGNNALAHERGD